MTDKNDPSHDERKTPDAWEDRLIDGALRELLGDERPPDLSDKILAAAKESPQVRTERKERVMGKSKGKMGRRLAWATATVACVVIGVGITLVTITRNQPRTVSMRSPSQHESQDSAQMLPEPFWTDDDVTYRKPDSTLKDMYDAESTSAEGSADGINENLAAARMQTMSTHRATGILVDRADGKNDDSSSTKSEPAPTEQSMNRSRDQIDEMEWVPDLDVSVVGGKDESSRDPVQHDTKENEFMFEGLDTTSPLSLTKPKSDPAESGDPDDLRMMVKPKIITSSDGKEALPRDARAGGRPSGPYPMSSSLHGKPARPSRLGTKTYPVADLVVPATEGMTGGMMDGMGEGGFEHFGLHDGRGPGRGGDQYTRVVDNLFLKVTDNPLSTFSIDVDTASYANVRRFLLAERRLPPPDAVRIEELINYFDYEYAGPSDDVPFASRIEVAGCPWQPEHRLVRVGLKGKELAKKERPKSNLVFLLDVSGSMSSNDKLPLLKEGMKLLAAELRKTDRVAIVVYAGSEGLVLPSTPGNQQETIQQSLDRLSSGGSTNGGAGIELAYKVARENFIEEGVNRVLLCTDGDFNVGTTSTAALERMVEERAKSGVFLSVLGFGRGNLNDAMMENISNKGNGNYGYIDGIREAKKVLIEQMSGTLVTIAKDVKIQIEFNPTQVAAYRLIGYANRLLAAEDFNDDKKDAGEIGAGHTVTALYELVPVGVETKSPSAETSAVDPLKYQKPAKPVEPVKPAEAVEQDESIAGELLTLKLRYKQPDGDTSSLLEFPVTDSGKGFGQASREMKLASAVASFGMLLRNSEHKGNATFDAVLEIATEAKGADPHGYRAEFFDMVRAAKELSGK